tara:strand:- start:204 stop:446 length:243 start_codon:yes stop_codon:yes gene_type:complete
VCGRVLSFFTTHNVQQPVILALTRKKNPLNKKAFNITKSKGMYFMIDPSSGCIPIIVKASSPKRAMKKIADRRNSYGLNV